MTDAIEVQAQWDPETGVWWAESAGLPGLVSEASTLDALADRASLAITELLAAAVAPPVLGKERLNRPGQRAGSVEGRSVDSGAPDPIVDELRAVRAELAALRAEVREAIRRSEP